MPLYVPNDRITIIHEFRTDLPIQNSPVFPLVLLFVCDISQSALHIVTSFARARMYECDSETALMMSIQGELIPEKK